MSVSEEVSASHGLPFGPNGCEAQVDGAKCGETKTLRIVDEFRELYEQKMEQIDTIAGGDCTQAKIKLQQEWINDLTSQNELLVRAVEELELEATERVRMLEEKMKQNAELTYELDEANSQIKNKKGIIHRLEDELMSNAGKIDTMKSLNDAYDEISELKKSMKEMRDALTAEVADKHDVIIMLRRDIVHLEDQCRKADQQTHFKDDIIKELRKEIKQLKNHKEKSHHHHNSRKSRSHPSHSNSEIEHALSTKRNALNISCNNAANLNESNQAVIYLKEDEKEITCNKKQKIHCYSFPVDVPLCEQKPPAAPSSFNKQELSVIYINPNAVKTHQKEAIKQREFERQTNLRQNVDFERQTVRQQRNLVEKGGREMWTNIFIKDKDKPKQENLNIRNQELNAELKYNQLLLRRVEGGGANMEYMHLLKPRTKFTESSLVEQDKEKFCAKCLEFVSINNCNIFQIIPVEDMKQNKQTFDEKTCEIDECKCTQRIWENKHMGDYKETERSEKQECGNNQLNNSNKALASASGIGDYSCKNTKPTHLLDNNDKEEQQEEFGVYKIKRQDEKFDYFESRQNSRHDLLKQSSKYRDFNEDYFIPYSQKLKYQYQIDDDNNNNNGDPTSEFKSGVNKRNENVNVIEIENEFKRIFDDTELRYLNGLKKTDIRQYKSTADLLTATTSATTTIATNCKNAYDGENNVNIKKTAREYGRKA